MIIRNIKPGETEDIKRLTLAGKPYLGLYHEFVYWLFENLYTDMCFVAEDEGVVKGFITTIPVPSHKATFVWQVGVDPAFRKQGAAYAMLRAAYLHGRELGYPGLIATIDADNAGSNATFSKLAREFSLHRENIGEFVLPGEYHEQAYLWK